MSGGALFWVIMFIISALLFFGIAAVVAVRGMRDLRDLLSVAEQRHNKNTSTNTP